MDAKVHTPGSPESTLARSRGLKFYNLSVRWGHGMPEWPSSPGMPMSEINTSGFHRVTNSRPD